MPWQDSNQSGCTVCTVEATVVLENIFGKVTLLGWFEDKKNTVELILMENKDKIVFKQKVNGDTVRKQSIPCVLNTGISYAVKISYSGGNFEVFLNDVLIRTISSGGLPFGNFGFRVQGTSSHFGNIHVQ
jgi:hypothetical protein